MVSAPTQKIIDSQLFGVKVSIIPKICNSKLFSGPEDRWSLFCAPLLSTKRTIYAHFFCHFKILYCHLPLRSYIGSHLRSQAYKYLLGKKVAQKRVQLVWDGHVRLTKACQLKFMAWNPAQSTCWGFILSVQGLPCPVAENMSWSLRYSAIFFVLFQLLLLIRTEHTDHSAWFLS